MNRLIYSCLEFTIGFTARGLCTSILCITKDYCRKMLAVCKNQILESSVDIMANGAPWDASSADS
jgi:hypothetical protein